MPKAKKWRKHSPKYRFSDLMKHIYAARYPTMKLVKDYELTYNQNEKEVYKPRRNSI